MCHLHVNKHYMEWAALAQLEKLYVYPTAFAQLETPCM